MQLLTPFYTASEPSTIGYCLDLNTYPRDVAYTIVPRPVFWEFIPVDQPEGDRPVTKLLHELEEGKSYELVLTNVSGLYRYRLEDVVRVTGFLHGLPQVQYEYRRGTLTITAKSEKVTEKDLAVAVGAIEERISPDGGRILDYTVAIDTESDPERYTLFVELDMMKRWSRSKRWRPVPKRLIRPCDRTRITCNTVCANRSVSQKSAW